MGPDADDEQLQAARTPETAPTKLKGSRRLKPWQIYAVAIAVVVVVLIAVLVPVLVHIEDRRTHEHQAQTPSEPAIARVNLGYAQYQGIALLNGVGQYLGMRFAAPPLGDLRWRAPVKPEKKQGDQAADQFGKICLGIQQPLPNDYQSEDCLFANVWAPTNATTSSKLPVWLFIQGGGYTQNTNANWNGSEVVERSGHNIVLVNFNYRVGLYGFLAGEQVRADGDLNVGLLDQRMMMQWVQAHINEFGGDPKQVIIHGASAGAGSVALHLIANGGMDEGLFHGGIGESIFFPAQPFVDELEWQFTRLLNQTSCLDASEPMKCLRNKDGRTLQNANTPTPFPGRTDAPLPLFYWTPCIDGKLLEDLPYRMFEQGRFIDVPILLGNDNDEGTVFAPNTGTPAQVEAFMRNNYQFLTDEETRNITEQYPKNITTQVPRHNVWFPAAQMAYGEATFICPAIHMLTTYVAHLERPRAWGYRYNVDDEFNVAAGIGVPHLFESFAIFGPDNVPGAPQSYYTYNAPIVPVVMDYWISFVRALDPNPFRNPAAPAWQPWGVDKHRLRFETNNNTMETTPIDQQNRCAMWRSLAPSMRQKR